MSHIKVQGIKAKVYYDCLSEEELKQLYLLRGMGWEAMLRKQQAIPNSAKKILHQPLSVPLTS